MEFVVVAIWIIEKEESKDKGYHLCASAGRKEVLRVYF